MLHLKQIELADLLDLLIEQTTYHTQLITKGASTEEFARSSEILKELQQEIELRNSTPAKTPTYNLTGIAQETRAKGISKQA
jgi:hypothetical protein